MAEQNLEQTISQRNIISQRQLRFVNALEKTAQEFDREVEKELEENSALEAESDPGHDELRMLEAKESPRYYQTHQSAFEERPEFAPRDDSATLYDSLRSQLAEQRSLSPEEVKAAEYVIDSLEPDGYLRLTTEDLRDDMEFHHGIVLPVDAIKGAVDAIRGMDPAGVGASDLRDCLLLQLRRMPRSEVRDDALAIVEKKFDALSARHYHKILSGLRIKEGRLRPALELITGLNPRPGLAIGDSTESTNIIIPDFIVSEDTDSGELTIHINNRIPELRIAESFESAVKLLEAGRRQRETKTESNQYILSKLNDAREFIQIFKQRQQTLFMVMSAIVKLQKDYFQTSDVYHLRPMMLKDIERETGLDLSTISRATKNKFVDLPWGIFPLRFFFTQSQPSESAGGATITNRQLEEEIRKIVKEENKKRPLSDQAIMDELLKRGFPISRRTVTKYRERIEIPIARLRKE